MEFRITILGVQVADIYTTFVSAFTALYHKMDEELPKAPRTTLAEMIDSTFITLSYDDLELKMDAKQAHIFAAQIGLLSDDGGFASGDITDPGELVVKGAFHVASIGVCLDCGRNHTEETASGKTGDPMLDAIITSFGGSVRVSGGPGFTMLEIGGRGDSDLRDVDDFDLDVGLNLGAALRRLDR